jgi:hypothetical protein
MPLVLLLQNHKLNYLAFHSSDFERTRSRSFQKGVVRTNFDINVFIIYMDANYYSSAMQPTLAILFKTFDFLPPKDLKLN